MENDFDIWNELKKNINLRQEPYFRESEIWWMALGVNVGVEINGKGKEFLRPVVILKKYNQFGCLILPLSSAREIDKDNVDAGFVQDRSATANLSQMKSYSSKRLIEKIRTMDKEKFISMQKAAKEYNFPSQPFEILPPEAGEQPEGQHTDT